MPATLKVTPKAIGVEVGRGTYEVMVDGTAEGAVASFRCRGKSILLIFLLSFAVPSLAKSPHRG